MCSTWHERYCLTRPQPTASRWWKSSACVRNACVCMRAGKIMRLPCLCVRKNMNVIVPSGISYSQLTHVFQRGQPPTRLRFNDPYGDTGTRWFYFKRYIHIILIKTSWSWNGDTDTFVMIYWDMCWCFFLLSTVEKNSDLTIFSSDLMWLQLTRGSSLVTFWREMGCFISNVGIAIS